MSSDFSADSPVVGGLPSGSSDWIFVFSSRRQNTFKGRYGIHVESGSEITIGGTNPEERNNIELGNEIGIFIEGENSDVTIVNNLVGEPEEWESGKRLYGNEIGIRVDGPAHDVTITGNTINANQESGIVLAEGSYGNTIYGNQITENGGHGIVVDGAATLRNFISRYSISRNLLNGIELLNGGNREIESPIITGVNLSEYNITGTVNNILEGSIVEVYADDNDEGLIQVGRSSHFGNNFYVSGNVPENANFHGIVIDPDVNTSQFGPCDIQRENEEVGSFVFAS